MVGLSRELRRDLERVVVAARRIAEEAARNALTDLLAVDRHEPWPTMTPDQLVLRNRLRARGRQLGDRRDAQRGMQEVTRLLQEVAYEHWHRMLFARFLAENDLLRDPEHGVAVTLDEVRELARERGTDWVAVASEFAVPMLPQVFRPGDPVLEVALAPEARKGLENLLEGLSCEVFVTDDSLGWVYQFWQSERKKEVNAAGGKIGAEELGPVTQLFTDDYMVEFLLHNTLGAWWVGRKHPDGIAAETEEDARQKVGLPGVTWTYLRFLKDDSSGKWRPAAGTFDGWPKAVKDVTVLDPSMGSGHFLVFALPILVAMRVHEEGLTNAEAVAAVLKDNLFGLEIDQRCTQIAAFNLALAGWKLAGYQTLPSMHIACSGLAPNAPEKTWVALAGGNDRLRRGMARLHALFKDAPVLGSLINPRATEGDLIEAEFIELQPLLTQVLEGERADEERAELGVAAQGLAKAAQILAGQYTIVSTNVPYLGRGRQTESLRAYCERVHPAAKADLGTCFVERCLSLCSVGGIAALVSPQNWLFLKRYGAFRRGILSAAQWRFVAQLGQGAFDAISGAVVNVALVAATNPVTSEAAESANFAVVDVNDTPTAVAKAAGLRSASPLVVSQQQQLKNRDAVITAVSVSDPALLSAYADSYQGIGTSDNDQFLRQFWELPQVRDTWRWVQTAAEESGLVGGCHCILLWEDGKGRYYRHAMALKAEGRLGGWKSGGEAWGRVGVAVNVTSSQCTNLYSGEMFDTTVAAIIPKRVEHLPAIFAFLSDLEYPRKLRSVDRALSVTEHTLLKVPFDLEHWFRVALTRYGEEKIKPRTSDPRQWLFAGSPNGSHDQLQVAVCRLLGYKWPRQTGRRFPECPAIEADGLEPIVDEDGILCLTSLQGEEQCAQRLRKLLAASYGAEWSATKQAELLAMVGFGDKSLDDWLRDGFFEQHCAVFHQRPFIWHIWDGRRDGFHALANYHQLAGPDGQGRKTLEKLTYAYLGDWISRQQAEQRAGKEGADARLAAALHLQGQLKKILEGEPPYDVFVRWKPLHEQAIGWEPDINDGVRMNIRPFMKARPLGARAKDACILRTTPKIKWTKDRGTEPERSKDDFPWFWGWNERTEDFEGGGEFDGNRWNDLHYTRKAKEVARESQVTGRKR